MSTIYGKPLFIGGGNPKVPEIFGTGADGDLYIAAGETVTLPVPVPHQSVVEMQYKSITIEAGGTLTTSDPNAGLVLRCQGDCVIHGTIDQSGKAPKTNPDSTYQYPEELQCGAGGAGGNGGGLTDYRGSGGAGMTGRPYGGGYGGGGGGGGGGYYSYGYGGNGGDGAAFISDEEIFVGGTAGTRATAGVFGGGGGGGSTQEGDGGDGGTGPGANGETAPGSANSQSSGGGAGNVGGGVVLLYIGGAFFLDGSIKCNGEKGGNGGEGRREQGTGPKYVTNGGGGGGGGGGSIYLLHMGTQTISGALEVNGGEGGSAVGYGGAAPGAAGGIGTTTIKQYEESA